MSIEEWYEDVRLQWQVIYDHDFNEDRGDEMMEEFSTEIKEMYDDGLDAGEAAIEILTLDDPDWEDRLACGYDDEEYEVRFGGNDD